MNKKTIETQPGHGENSTSTRPRHPITSDAKQYSHILVPTGLKPSERVAVMLGLRMAAAMEAKVTLLHVVPVDEGSTAAAEPATSRHWLDAIDRLHAALSRPRIATVSRNPQEMLNETRARVRAYLEREIPAVAWQGADVRMESRQGDVVNEILRFTRDVPTDLVILTSRLSHWWLPILSPRLHRMLRQVRKEVVVVRPGADRDDATTSVPHGSPYLS